MLKPILTDKNPLGNKSIYKYTLKVKLYTNLGGLYTFVVKMYTNFYVYK